MRINTWSQSGIVSHQEFPPDKFELALRMRAAPRGGVKIRLESPDGNYPDRDEFVNRGFWGKAVGVKGAHAFVGLPKDLPSVAGRLRASGYKLSFSRVVETAPKPTAKPYKFDPNQPRDPAGTPTGGQWTGDSNPYMNTEVPTSGAISSVLGIARERLMPPQYQEVLSSLQGNTSRATRNYWADVLLNWADVLFEDGGISEYDYNEIGRMLARGEDEL